jgi:hypothetical protein
MTEIDRRLFSCHVDGPYADEEWRAIIGHVIGKLEEFLGQPVVASDIQLYGDGFAGDIACASSFGGKLQLSWFGRIGAMVLGDREMTDLSAWLFLRGYGKRLVAIGGEAFLYLNYREIKPGHYGWSAEWDRDEHHEFESWE